ncbi:Exportin-2, partial [Rhizophlyctis rosea]
MDPNAVLISSLEATLNPDHQIRRQAEQTLAQGEKRLPQFSVLLLQLVGSDATLPTVRTAASLYFKNFVKRCWKQVEGEPDLIPEEDRTTIKANIVHMMIAVPTTLQAQLSEAVSLIADNDFPFDWQNLLPDLLSKLNTTDYKVNVGVLQTAHSIFRRYRHQFATDRLFVEIKFVLDNFAAPYLQFFQTTDQLIDQNANNAQALKPMFGSLLLLVKIFYSLTSQEYAEFFEDHYNEFFSLLHKYLKYTNPLLESDDDEQAGPLEKVKAVICEVAHMFASKYADDFKNLQDFMVTIWQLLTTIGPEKKNDLLTSKAISFLTVIVKQQRNRHMFEAPETLTSICEKIVLPNMQLRESDEEKFEDDPIEYIRMDLEGDDTESRRRAASDLVKGLLENFKQEVTTICHAYVNKYLETYEADRSKNWKAKDAALYLIMSLSAQSSTAEAGATRTNEFIPILPVLQQQ